MRTTDSRQLAGWFTILNLTIGAAIVATGMTVIDRADARPSEESWKVGMDGMAQGRIEMCIACHGDVALYDYVFMTALQAAEEEE